MTGQRPSWRDPNVRMKFDLTSPEMVWRDRQKMLERRGYLLRPRFRPEWAPSWLNTGKSPLLCEDGLFNPLASLIDAKRLSDGTQVMIKCVDRDSNETEIGLYLSSSENSTDPSNHCVPILDVIRDESEPYSEFIVMPLLRPFNDPPFFTVEEVLDFCRQTLSGLDYMHRLGIAHRDCSIHNLMFDAAGMYPNGFHASVWILDANGKITKPLRRSDVKAVKYYFTDFGISTRFRDGEPRLVKGIDGLDQDVPELSSFHAYDPFAADIFILGNVFKKELVEKYTNLQFMLPLVEKMTQRTPSERPTASQAAAQFESIVASVPGFARRWRLKEVGKGRISSFFVDMTSANRECLHILKTLFRKW